MRSSAAGNLRIATIAAAALYAPGATGPRSEPTADQIVTARQAALDLSVIAVSQMRAAVDAGREPRTQAYAAASLAKWATALPALFPAGTGAAGSGVPTRAEPAIWTDRAGFERAATAYREAAVALSRQAAANDPAAFRAQLAEVEDSCTSCHASYKGGDR